MTIARVVTKVSIDQQSNGAVYWRTQPVATRLAAVEELRREYHQWKYDAEPRLQRIYSVTQRA